MKIMWQHYTLYYYQLWIWFKYNKGNYKVYRNMLWNFSHLVQNKVHNNIMTVILKIILCIWKQWGFLVGESNKFSDTFFFLLPYDMLWLMLTKIESRNDPYKSNFTQIKTYHFNNMKNFWPLTLLMDDIL